MKTSLPPLTRGAARALTPRDGPRTIEALRDGDLWVRFVARPTSGPQEPHARDEFYVVASGTARYRWDGGETEIAPGDLFFASAHTAHGYDRLSDDFAVWVVFHGPERQEIAMDRTPPPLSIAAARALKLPADRRSAEVFTDGDLEIRFYAPPGHDPQTPHDRDELYIVAAGRGMFRVGEQVHAVAPGDLLYAAAHELHRFEDFSPDFAVWVVFYGPVK
jgi:mannose-6-phosphate isomerase-like protein (cupin superfamily)